MLDSFSNIYLRWLKENMDEVIISDGVYRVTTPFLDKNNAMTEVYIIRKSENSYKITDDSNTFNELELSGFDYSTGRRKQIISNIICSYGITMGEDNELYVECTNNNFALKKHLLIQCIIKISDLCYLTYPNIKSLFIEDIQKLFEDNDILFVSDLSFNGKSKLQSNYDFALPKSKKSPERLIKAINSIDTNIVRSTIFSWEDVREVRPPNTQLITIINDQNKKISKDNIIALEEYNIYPLLWSKRDEEIKKLIA